MTPNISWQIFQSNDQTHGFVLELQFSAFLFERRRGNMVLLIWQRRHWLMKWSKVNIMMTWGHDIAIAFQDENMVMYDFRNYSERLYFQKALWSYCWLVKIVVCSDLVWWPVQCSDQLTESCAGQSVSPGTSHTQVTHSHCSLSPVRSHLLTPINK